LVEYCNISDCALSQEVASWSQQTIQPVAREAYVCYSFDVHVNGDDLAINCMKEMGVHKILQKLS